MVVLSNLQWLSYQAYSGRLINPTVVVLSSLQWSSHRNRNTSILGVVLSSLLWLSHDDVQKPPMVVIASSQQETSNQTHTRWTDMSANKKKLPENLNQSLDNNFDEKFIPFNSLWLAMQSKQQIQDIMYRYYRRKVFNTPVVVIHMDLYLKLLTHTPTAMLLTIIYIYNTAN